MGRRWQQGVVQHATGAAALRLINDAAAALNEGDLFIGTSTGDVESHATGATVTARARGAVKQPASFGERLLKSRTRPSSLATQRARLARTQTRQGSADAADGVHPRGRAQGHNARCWSTDRTASMSETLTEAETVRVARHVSAFLALAQPATPQPASGHRVACSTTQTHSAVFLAVSTSLAEVADIVLVSRGSFFPAATRKIFVQAIYELASPPNFRCVSSRDLATLR